MGLQIWVCTMCGDQWELESGVLPTRDRLGNVACARCKNGLPIAPLLARVGPVENDGVLAEVLGVSRKWVGAHRSGGISLRYAERFADRLGVHPSVLWPEEYPAAIRED